MVEPRRRAAASMSTVDVFGRSDQAWVAAEGRGAALVAISLWCEECPGAGAPPIVTSSLLAVYQQLAAG